MRQAHSKLSPWLIVALLIMALFLVFQWLRWSFNKRIDLGNKPASRVFRQVFLCPIPAGVSELRVAGMSSLSGEVWMRFRVQDVHSFLVSMGRNPRMSITVSSSDLSAYVIPTKMEADRDHYARAVDWDQVYQVRHPEPYVFESNPPGHDWFGQMVLDREQKTVYVHGGLM